MGESYDIFDTICGKIVIRTDGAAITHILSESKVILSTKPEHALLTDQAAKELSEYFEGKRKNFCIPLNPQGTEFQKKVWKALLNVPYGETRTYKDIAIAIGSEKASRAVGLANNKNPIWIVIPCHRIIGANGSLTGYGGGLDMKKKLLELEKENT